MRSYRAFLILVAFSIVVGSAFACASWLEVRSRLQAHEPLGAKLSPSSPGFPQPKETSAPDRSESRKPGVLTQHPKLFFSTSDIPGLQAKAQSGDGANIARAILSFAQSHIDDPSPTMPTDPSNVDNWRYPGDDLIGFAMAYVLSGNSSYLDLTRRYMLGISSWHYWGDEGGYGGIRLGFAHILQGMAIAYDWTYNALSDTDRATIRQAIAAHADLLYQASSEAGYNSTWGNWWKEAYLQNHYYVIHSALGNAALALEGEDSRTTTWLPYVIDKMTRGQAVFNRIGDGSWHEGILYGEYAVDRLLAFDSNLLRLKGQNILPETFLRNYPVWRAYNYLPGTWHFALDSGDMTWWGSYRAYPILRFIATQYEDGRAEWMAQQLESSTKLAVHDSSVTNYVWELIYYDPNVQPQAPSDLPLSRTFPDMEGAIWRTGWGSSDLVFGIKDLVQGGRWAFNAFQQRSYPFNTNTGWAQITAGHEHDDSGSFYLYSGDVDLTSENMTYDHPSSSLHNTFMVDGKSQYEDPNDRDPTAFKNTDGRLEQVGDAKNFDYLVMDNTNRYQNTDSSGYPTGPVLSEMLRYVLFNRTSPYFVMVDNLRAGSSHQYDSYIHFGSSASVQGSWIKGVGSDGNQVVGVKVLSPSGVSVSVGNDGKAYAKLSTKAANAQYVTVLQPTDQSGWSSLPKISLIGANSQVVGIRVALNGTQDHLIQVGPQTITSMGDYSFDGKTASVLKDSTGNLQEVFLGNGTTLSDSHGRRTLIKADSQATALEASYSGAILRISGGYTGGARFYGPQIDPRRVTLNGKSVKATGDGDYIVVSP